MAIKKFNAVQGFSVGDNDTIYDVIDSAANVTANNLTVNGTTQLGEIANVSITGGTDGYVLRTDGLGNLSWENPADVGVVGSNTEIQFNDDGLFGASANFTFNKSSNTLTVDKIIANGIGLTNMNGANVTGTVANANYAAYSGNITIAAQPNITSVGTLVSANITGNLKTGNANLGNLVVANYISGDGSLLVNLTGANVTGTVSDATTAVYAGTVTTRAQPNITSVGTLVTANITGNLRAGNANLGNLVTANFFNGDGGFLSNIVGSNVIGAVTDATTAVTAGTVTVAAQPNITSVGTLSSANITGNLKTGNANLGNLAVANYFSGAGNLLSNIVGGNVTGQVANSLIAGTVYANAQPNITSVGTLVSIDVSGNITSGGNVIVTANVSATNANLGNLVTANYFKGSGNLLTNIVGSNVTGQVANALIAGTVYSNEQPNITSVGTLSSLSVTGDATINGNVTVSGSFQYANVTTFRVKDPIIEQGGTTSGAALTSNDGYDRGQLLHYYSGAPFDAFMGWDNSNAEFGLGSVVTVSSEVVTFNTYGNLRAGYYFGNASQLTGTIANANYASFTGNVIGAIQSNITSVGTLSSLNVTSNITSGGNLLVTANVSSGNANLGNLVTANYFSGAGNLLSNIVGGNVTGQVANALIAGTVYTAAQPNITSVGTLSVVNVTGNITSGGNLLVTANVSANNANLGNLVTANYFSGAGNLLSNIVGGNVTGQVANSLIAGTVYTNAQPNITSVGTLSSVNVSGNITSGGNVIVTSNVSANNANLGNLVTANYFTGTLTTNAQPNITSVGTLVSADVLGNITSGGNVIVTANVSANNANLGNLVTANYFSGAGNLLSNIVGSNVTGQVANALIAGTVYTAAQPNITSVGTLVSTSLAANAVLTLSGSASQLTGANLVSANYVAGTLTTSAQPNITSVGTLTSVNVTGNVTSGGNLLVTANVSANNANLGNLVTANYFSGDGSLLTNLTGANVTSQVANSLIAGTVYSNAQPNITSVGTLVSANVSGNITSGGNLLVTANISSGNANLGNLVTANYFTGNGSLLTSLTGANITSQVANALIAGTVYTNAQPNITSVGTLSSVNVSGNITSGGNVIVTANVSASNANLGNLVTANYFVGAGNLLSNIVGSNVTGQVANALIAGTVYTNAQPNITSVGTLSSLTVSGDTTLTGNVTVTGTFEIVDVATFKVQDPIIEQGGNTTGAALTSNDGYDRGQILHYYSGTAKDAFMGWDNSNAEFAFGSNVSVSSEVVTFNEFGNIRANYFLGNASQLVGTIANANYAAYAGNVVNATQSNITSVGTLATLAIASTGSVSGGNLVSANYITGTLTNSVQPNITSVGTLDAVNVTGNISSGNANLGNLATASFFSGAGNLLSNIVGGNVTGQVANSLIAGTVYTNAQPNITSVGTLSSLTVTANVTSGNANLGNLVTANYFAGTVTTSVQPNITSVGSLSGLTVSNASGTVNLITTSNVSLGAIANLHISGGTSGYVLSTDGSGSLSWTNPTTVGIAGSNTQLQFNDDSSFGASANLTFNKTTGLLAVTGNVQRNGKSLMAFSSGSSAPSNPVAGDEWYDQDNDIIYKYIFDGTSYYWIDSTSGYLSASTSATANTLVQRDGNGNVSANFFIGDGSMLTGVGSAGGLSNGTSNITAGILNGNITVGVAGVSNTVVFTSAGMNVIATGGINAGNTVTANYILGNGYYLTGLPATYANSNVASYLPTYTGNITGNIVTLTGNVTAINASLGNLVTANYFTGNGSLLTSITGANVTGTVANATYAVSAGSATTATTAATLTTNAQPNITSVGTLSSLTVTANISSGNANLGNLVTANYHAGNGSLLTSLTGANVTGTVANATYSTTAGTVTANTQSNITSVGTLAGLTATGVVNLTGASNVSLGANSVVKITGGTTGQYLYTDGAGNLAWGTIATAALSNGTSNVSIPLVNGNVIIGVGGNTTMTVATTGANVAGYLSVTGNVTAANATLGNLVTANYFTGNGSLLTSITGANVTGTVANATYAVSAGSATTAATVTTAAQPNITSVGTLASLNVTGNISSGNANLGNLVTANYFSGNGSLLTSLAAANIAGQVANALVAGTVYTNAQPNITSVGTLSSLDVTATITAGTGSGGSILGANLVSANYFTGTLTTAVQPNITSVGTLDSLNVTGNATATYFIGNGSQLTGLPATYANSNVASYLPTYTGNITGNIVTLTGNVTAINANLGNLVTANYFTGSGNLLANIQGPNVTGQVANALVAGTVYTNAQPNITSVGTLASLTVSGTTDLGSITNLKLSGGVSGYGLVTDGLGNLSWSSTAGGSGASSFVSVAKDNFVGDSSTNAFVLAVLPSSVQAIVVNINGLVQQVDAYSLTGSTVSFASAPATGVKIEVTTYGVVSVTGSATEVQYNNGTGFSSSSAFTFNDTTNALSVSGNVSSGGNLVVSGGSATIGTGIIAVSSGNAGIFTSGIGNVNIGLAGNVTLGGSTSNTTVRGNLIANSITSNSTISGNTITATNLRMNDLYSNRTPITVIGTTVIDSFALNKYRTAKYTIRVGSDDGYQSIEVLLIHDDLSTHITVYGSISTSGYDIVLISSAINSGNVELAATTSSANTTVNMIGTYVAD